MYHDNDEFIRNVIKDIKRKNWNELQRGFAEILIQIPEDAPAYQNIFEIFLMAITLNDPDGSKTCYSGVKDLPAKMIKRVERLKQG